MLKLKLQYFGHLMQRATSLEKTLKWEKLRTKEKGATEDMVGWHHQLSGHGYEKTQGDSEGQRSLSDAVHGAAELDRT